MVNWNFDCSQYKEQSFTPIPVGDHRVRIATAEEKVSSSGNQMIVLTLDVSGYNSRIWHNVVLNPEKQELTNQKLGELFNSFGIQPGNFNLAGWVGKVGAAKVKHEQYNGETSPKVHYFVGKDRQDKLPAWVEPSNKAAVTGGGNNDFTPVDIPDDLPFAQ